MTLEQLGNAGDFLGGIAVIISLVYVALQLRRNSLSLRASTFQEVTGSFTTFTAALSSNPELVHIWMTGLEGGELSDEEKKQFAFQILTAMRLQESAYFQWRSGILSDDQWEGHSVSAKRIVSSPGGQEFWPLWRLHFSQVFQEFVEQAQAQKSRNSDPS
jgi:hypothetical protein